eukprot:jgi/Hompol1/5455/HPOL_004450-RA
MFPDDDAIEIEQEIHSKPSAKYDAKFEDEIAILPRRSSRAPSLPRIEEAGQKSTAIHDEAFKKGETLIARKLSTTVRRGSTENLLQATRAATLSAQPNSTSRRSSARRSLEPSPAASAAAARPPSANYAEFEEQEYRPQKFDKEKFTKANKKRDEAIDASASSGSFGLHGLQKNMPELTREISAISPKYLDDKDEDLMNEILNPMDTIDTA